MSGCGYAPTLWGRRASSDSLAPGDGKPRKRKPPGIGDAGGFRIGSKEISIVHAAWAIMVNKSLRGPAPMKGSLVFNGDPHSGRGGPASSRPVSAVGHLWPARVPQELLEVDAGLAGRLVGW